MSHARAVLIVEDQQDARNMLVDYLTVCGFVVFEAQDGLEAIDVAIRVHPCVILMDLNMPRLDGWEATRRLKADARTRTAKIIAVSAVMGDDEQHRARLAGCDDFVQKPYDPAHLENLVCEAFRSTLDSRAVT
jgi:two-component system, cell cycle response regulator DivK